jgi:predicted MPP superfamily phosphohydrolase
MSFSLVIATLALFVHAYLWFGLVRRLRLATPWRRATGGVLVAMTLLIAGRSWLRGSLGELSRAYEITVYVWVAIAVCMLLALWFGDLVRLGALVARKVRRTAAPVDDDRREFITRTLPRSVAATGAIITGYGTYRAFTPPEVTETVIPIAKLPPSLEGLRIVQLTDIHVGPFIRRKLIDRLVEQANALRPDLLVITGDMVDGKVPELGDSVAGLGNLRARFGTFFVTGNHDYGSGDREWVAFLEQHGIPSLRNRRVEIGDAGGSIDLIGVDDWSSGRRRGRPGYDLDAAIAGRDPDRASVLLAHQPANFDEVVAQGIDLQISGHTHGGQIFPMTHMVGVRYPYDRGLFREGDAHIYVSRGCGFWGPPARVGSPPELATIILVRA